MSFVLKVSAGNFHENFRKVSGKVSGKFPETFRKFSSLSISMLIHGFATIRDREESRQIYYRSRGRKPEWFNLSKHWENLLSLLISPVFFNKWWTWRTWLTPIWCLAADELTSDLSSVPRSKFSNFTLAIICRPYLQALIIKLSCTSVPSTSTGNYDSDVLRWLVISVIKCTATIKTHKNVLSSVATCRPIYFISRTFLKSQPLLSRTFSSVPLGAT